MVSDFQVVCPKCSRLLKKLYWGVVSCRPCKAFFHVDEYSNLDVSLSVECPECDEEFALDYWGSVICPGCRKRFEVDADGDVV